MEASKSIERRSVSALRNADDGVDMRISPETLIAVIVLLNISTIQAAESPERLTCIPEQKFLCSSSGCKNIPAKVNALLDLETQTYSRCDTKGCDKYMASMSIGGIYLNVTVPGKSVVAKVEIPTLEYFETVSSGLAVATSFGKCTR